MILEHGAKLGPYEILEPLGAGGMGEVYKARDTRLDRTVAVKISTEQFTQRFEREARAVAALNHPHICTLHDVGPNYLVMEYIEGPTLAERIRTGAIPLEEALPIARQIAEALEAAHEKGIIHRDLKPANVKFTADGSVKVLDFGLAKALESDSVAADPRSSPTLTLSATRAGVILGTAAYMSPEQAKGKTVDRRADIWAFGVVLMEMLTGRHLYTGETVSETLAAVIMKEPDLSGLPPGTPSAVRQLLRRCLDRDPHRRLRDIGEARIAIDHALAGELEQEVRLMPAPRRSILPWVLVATAVLITAAFGIVLWHVTRPAERPLMTFSIDLGPDAVAGRDTTVALSPDGKRMVFPARTSDGKPMLAIRLLDQPKATLLSGTDKGTEAFFSPDGQWVGFFADSKLKKVSVRGGAPVVLCDAALGRGASWGRDGNIIAALSIATGLSRIPEAGGQPQLLTKPADKRDVTHRWPQILSGGEAVLFTAHSAIGNFDDANIEAVILKTGQRKTVHRGGYFGRYLPSGHLVFIHRGTLFGVPFDPVRLEAKDTPVPLVENVAANVDFGGGQYDFSQTGTFVCRTGQASVAAWPVLWMDSSGQTQPLIRTPAHYRSPRFSPDGKRLAVAVGYSESEIWVYDLQREAATKLTFTGRNQYPVWTPGGKHIVYQSQLEHSIMWMRADGAGEPHRLLEGIQVKLPYSFSPDGRRLAFSEMAGGSGFDLWTLPLDLTDPDHPKPGKPELFLGTSASENYPALSPDGQWMAYQSNESGIPEIYVRPFAAGSSPGGGKWQISTGGGAFPIWSRAGRQLLYRSEDGHVMMIDYTASGDSFRPDKPRRWADRLLWGYGIYPSFDLAPDGKRVAMLPLAEETDAKGNLHVTMLLNFFDEVRRRVSARSE